MNPPSKTKPTLLALAWPIFIEQALRVLIGTVDTFMVSHVSDNAVAALGVAHQVVILGLIIFNFIGIGSSVVITHHLGGGDRKGADQIAASAIAVNTWIGLLISIPVCLFATPMLQLLQLPGNLMQYAVPFLTLMGGTLFIESMNISMGSVLRAHTHTREAMFVTILQNIINVLGNCLLLFGFFGLPKMGVVGVALSSVFSRIVAAACLWYLVHKYTNVRMHLRDYLSIPWERLRSILRIGLPAAGENISWWLAYMTITTFAARMGAVQLATMSYTMQVVTWVILFGSSIGLGTEIVIGHLVGAGDFEEAHRELMRSLKISFILVISGVVVVAIAAPWLIGIFTKDPQIIATGTLLLRIGLILEPGRIFNLVVINSLRATGDARFPVMMGMCSMWGIWVPLAWLLGLHFGFGLLGLWCGMVADEWVRGIAMYRRWQQRHWVKHAEHSRQRVQNLASESSASA